MHGFLFFDSSDKTRMDNNNCLWRELSLVWSRNSILRKTGKQLFIKTELRRKSPTARSAGLSSGTKRNRNICCRSSEIVWQTRTSVGASHHLSISRIALGTVEHFHNLAHKRLHFSGVTRTFTSTALALRETGPSSRRIPYVGRLGRPSHDAGQTTHFNSDHGAFKTHRDCASCALSICLTCRLLMKQSTRASRSITTESISNVYFIPKVDKEGSHISFKKILHTQDLPANGTILRFFGYHTNELKSCVWQNT